ncbi:MAG TPA: hypothetical protein VGS21_12425 [Acidimicrobiales bacterium]|nr:hypothetical protein [Acidimicrobiales bacterium]
MTLFEYLLNFALIGLVFLQVRGRKLTVRNMLLPVVITAVVVKSLLGPIPTAGNDLVLVVGLATLGAIFGSLAALKTSLHSDGAGGVIAKAGLAAAALWVVGIGSRVGFSLFVQHGGAASVARFSAANHITSAHAWGAGFVLMAILEVVSRTGVLYLRARQAGAHFEAPRRVRQLAA